MLGRHDHDHRHPQGTQFRRVGSNGGQGQLALAQGTVGRMLLQQVDARPGLGPQHAIANIRQRHCCRGGQSDWPVRRNAATPPRWWWGPPAAGNGSRVAAAPGDLPFPAETACRCSASPAWSPAATARSTPPRAAGRLWRAKVERSAIRSPTTRQRGWYRRGSCCSTASDMAATRSFQRGQRATHSA